MKKLHIIGICVLSVLIQAKVCWAQTTTFAPDSLNSDELFEIGRNLAFDGQRSEARFYLKRALEKSPQYLEIKVFLARTYAWDQLRDTALTLLDEVLVADAKYKDAMYAKLDVLYWSEKYAEMLLFADVQLKKYTTDERLLIYKAKALIALEKPEEAAVVLNQVLVINPGNEEARELLASIKTSQLKHHVAVNYALDHFGKIFGNAHYQFLQYNYRTKYGALLTRINTAQRFDTSGFQPEIDYYPTLGKGFYAYLNYGISGRALFPKHRLGIELYKNLPLQLEASFGWRYLYFDRSSNLSIYTATVGWYVGNYWLSLRTFITPDGASNSFSRSLIFIGRRYFKDAQNFLGIQSNIGFTPDNRLQANGAITGDNEQDLYFLKSRRIGFEYQRTFGTRFIWNMQSFWSDLELNFDRGNFVNIWGGQTTLTYQF